MKDLQLGVIETKFAEIIWENEPVNSTQLVRIAEKQLEWKKSTTYTVLKRLCEKGLFENNQGVVQSKIKKGEFYSLQSERFVDETFKGSLPAFFAAFTGRRKLTKTEIDELKRMVNEYEE